MNTNANTIIYKSYPMKIIVDILSHVLLFIFVPLIFLVYVFMLVLFAVARTLFYIFDKTERKRDSIINKILFPLHKR